MWSSAVLAAPPEAVRPVAPAWQLEALLWSTSPVAFDQGLVLGAGARVRHVLTPGEIYVGAALGVGETSEATAAWQLTHLHGALTAEGGVERSVGVARVRAGLGLGVLALWQLADRQQITRLEALGTGDLHRSGVSVGPLARATFGLALTLHDPWTVTLELGPGVTVQRVANERRARVLFESGLGVGRAF